MTELDEDTEQLQIFLNKLLPECMEKCDEYTKQVIIDGHKQMESHLLTKCQNISKEKLSKDMEITSSELQQRIYQKFTKKYQDFVFNHILIFKDDESVTNIIIKPSKDKYQSYYENLAKQKNELYLQYTQKQKILKKLNEETIQLQNQFNNALQSINNNYQSMRSQIDQKHKLLISQLQRQFNDNHSSQRTQPQLQPIDINQINYAKREQKTISQWGDAEISAILPL